MPAWNRLIRFVAKEDGQVYSGEPLLADTDDVGLLVAQPDSNVRARVLARDDPLDPSLAPTPKLRTVRRLLPPLDPARIPAVRALGANFVQPGQDPQLAKSEAKRPKLPILFYKPSTCVVGPREAIRVPSVAHHETDYEVELVVVLAKDCRDVPRDRALDYVLAYTLSNDVSARKRMFAVPQWGLGKSFDTFLPLGPCLVSARSGLIPRPEDVQLRTKLNGDVVQQGVCDDMLFGVAETIEWLSQGTTLQAGSIISMGTPPGEGFKRNPPRFLRDGDVCELHGSHGLGTLVNPVVFEPPTSGQRAKL